MKEEVEELKARELNQTSEEIKDRLDGQGNQDNLDVLDENVEENVRPTIDFTEWLDDTIINEVYSKNDDSKFRLIELQSIDELLNTTKTSLPEQMVVLQKVLLYFAM